MTERKYNPVVHFEIQVDNLKRAKKFYEGVFDWVIQEFEGKPGMAEYWVVMTTPKGHHELGINGGMLKRPCPAPKLGQGTNAFVCTVSVEDFDETAKKIKQHKGKVAMPKFEIMTQMGKSHVGYFIDTEGNTFGVIENTDYNKSKKSEGKK